jgi:hypothetical protein
MVDPDRDRATARPIHQRSVPSIATDARHRQPAYTQQYAQIPVDRKSARALTCGNKNRYV